MNYSTTNAPEDGTTLTTGREAKDSWNQTWTIAALSDGLEELLVNGSPPQFSLERTPGTTPAVYALKPVIPVELPVSLAPSVLLTQRGTTQLGPLKCTTPLCASFVAPHKPYWDVSEEVVCDGRDLRRLEGTIEMSDGSHTLCLYQVDNVLTEGKTLLVLDIKSKKSKANPDGSAIGHN